MHINTVTVTMEHRLSSLKYSREDREERERERERERDGREKNELYKKY